MYRVFTMGKGKVAAELELLGLIAEGLTKVPEAKERAANLRSEARGSC